jgi:hypothetical protein
LEDATLPSSLTKHAPLVSFFDYPARAVREFADRDRSLVLKQGLNWFATTFFPLIVLTFVCGLTAATSMRKSDEDSHEGRVARLILRSDLMTVGLFLWLFAGLRLGLGAEILMVGVPLPTPACPACYFGDERHRGIVGTSD